jgi:hypothetical protein
VSTLWSVNTYSPQPGSTQDPVTEASLGLSYRSNSPFRIYSRGSFARAALNYVTGAHAFKVGLTWLDTGAVWANYQRAGDARFTVLNGVPLSVTYFTTPYYYAPIIRPNVGVFAQDQWTIRCVTFNGGLRFDSFKNTYDAVDMPPTQWLKTDRHFPGGEILNWKDINPRLSVAYPVAACRHTG